MKELREHLDKEGIRLGRHLITSSATGATTIWLEHTNMGEASKYLDSVNIKRGSPGPRNPYSVQ